MLVDIIKGGEFADNRGILRFINGFKFEGIQRFYTIKHDDTSIIRAWQGHKIEEKFFYVIKGEFTFNWVKIDDWDNPSKVLPVSHVTLNEQSNEILKIPAGYANAIKANLSESIVICFSNLTLEDSKNDDFRFDQNYWVFYS